MPDRTKNVHVCFVQSPPLGTANSICSIMLSCAHACVCLCVCVAEGVGHICVFYTTTSSYQHLRFNTFGFFVTLLFHFHVSEYLVQGDVHLPSSLSSQPVSLSPRQCAYVISAASFPGLSSVPHLCTLSPSGPRHSLSPSALPPTASGSSSHRGMERDGQGGFVWMK